MSDPLGLELKKAILDHGLYRIARDQGKVTVEVQRGRHPVVHATFPGRWLCLTLWLPQDYEQTVMAPGLVVCDGLTLQAAPVAERGMWPPGVEGCWLAQSLEYTPARHVGDTFQVVRNFIVSYGGELARHEDPLIAFHKLERRFHDALVPPEDGLSFLCGYCGKRNGVLAARCVNCDAFLPVRERRICGSCQAYFCDPQRHRCPSCHRRKP